MPDVKVRPITMKVVGSNLKDSTLHVRRFWARESMCELFLFEVFFTTEGQTVPFEQALGKPVVVTVPVGAAGQRFFHGLCNDFSEVRDFSELAYRARVVPRAWLLTRRVQSRVFENEDVRSILKKVFQGAGLQVSEGQAAGSAADVVLTTFTSPHVPHDYCTQYRESDFAFASRLMEEEGISYFFRATASGHQMIVADDTVSESLYPLIPEPVSLRTSNVSSPAGPLGVFSWEKGQVLTPTRYVLREHHFERNEPIVTANSDRNGSVPVGGVDHPVRFAAFADTLEISQFPGEFNHRFDNVDGSGGDRSQGLDKFKDEGDRVAKLRLQQETVHSLGVEASGFHPNYTAASRFKVTVPDDQKGVYLLTQVIHAAEQGSGRAGDAGGSAYNNTFRCMPFTDKFPYKPPRVTPRPVVIGSQTALVVGQQQDGAKTEEIFTDKFGRVKVQFHWDRLSQRDAQSSCWVRVASPWAGKHWGMIHLPRVGQEVVVTFLEGNPDMPLIVGSVYNFNLPPPWDLPKHKTQSGIKTQSNPRDPKDNTPHFNELRFEDEKGKEDISFRAEKDSHRLVNNDDHLCVGHDQFIHIHHDRTETVKEGNEVITIEKGDRTETVKKGDESISIEKGDRTVVLGEGKDTHQLKQGDREVKIDMGNDSLTISMGNQTTKLDLGKSETEAMQSIVLKVGQSSIKIDQTGVTIKGMMISVEGQVTTELKSPMTTVKGDGMLTLKGGVTMIG